MCEPVLPLNVIEPLTLDDEPVKLGVDIEPDGVIVADPPVPPNVEYVEPFPKINLSFKFGK